MISMCSGFKSDRGNPEPDLKLLSEAGFSHVHWVHHWADDFMYGTPEIDQIEEWLRDFGLSLHGIHASSGQEKGWTSTEEHQRKAGVELVRNRMEMASRLSGSFIVLHPPLLAHDNPESWDSVRRSLDELEPVAKANGVGIAIENMINDDFKGLAKLLDEYPPEFLGICYDTGHGNMGRAGGIQFIKRRKSRLMALHLHDNNGFHDQHKPLFTGTVPWGELAELLAGSPCHDRISLEVNSYSVKVESFDGFLKDVLKGAAKFERMVRQARKAKARA